MAGLGKARGTGHQGFSGRTIGRMISKPSKVVQPAPKKGGKKK